MKQQKGQIIYIVLFLIIVGIGLITVVPKLNLEIFKKKASFPEKPQNSEQITDLKTDEETQKEEPEEPKDEQEKEEPTEKPSPDNTPPERYKGFPEGELPAATRKAEIGLKTNEKAICRYSPTEGVYYEKMQEQFSNTNATSHSALITTLSEGREYKYYVRCADKQGNKNKDDFIISFEVKTPEDITAPERKYLMPSGTLPAGTKDTTLQLTTDEEADCRYSQDPGESFHSMGHSFSSNDLGTLHTANVDDLEDGELYNFYVKCEDTEGNENDGNVLISFEIANP